MHAHIAVDRSAAVPLRDPLSHARLENNLLALNPAPTKLVGIAIQANRDSVHRSIGIHGANSVGDDLRGLIGNAGKVKHLESDHNLYASIFLNLCKELEVTFERV